MNEHPVSDHLLEVVASLYASALDPRQVVPALNSLSAALASSATQIYTYDRASGTVLESQTNDRINESANQLYVTHWGQYDPGPVVLGKLGSGTVLRCQEFFDAEYVSKSAFYQDFFIPFGFRWRMGYAIHSDDGTSTVVAALRGPDMPPYDSASAESLAKLLPHFRRAAVLRRQLASRLAEQFDGMALIEQLSTACLIVDRKGRVIVRNDSASAVFRELPVVLAGCYLRFPSGEKQREWLACLQTAVQTTGGATLELLAADAVLWELQVIRWKSITEPRDGSESELLLVTMQRKGIGSRRQVTQLSAANGLTHAETEVLDLLVAGYSAREIAGRRGSSANTVRNQLTAILEKTGSHSQRALLRRFNPRAIA